MSLKANSQDQTEAKTRTGDKISAQIISEVLKKKQGGPKHLWGGPWPTQYF